MSNRKRHHLTVISDNGPSFAQLDAIEDEMPVIGAEVELLDAQIAVLDRTPSEVDRQRLRRAEHRLLAARRDLANRSGGKALGGAA
ncbi:MULTISPECIES: DUF6284 family protein [Streptomyces]|uniref:DUF6284 family protein n=1 Tax=Streptomyces TaxID=1883 RepID=UPI00030625A0|nr:DUF6284 family protein [Streptomyces sp. AA1529]